MSASASIQQHGFDSASNAYVQTCGFVIVFDLSLVDFQFLYYVFHENTCSIWRWLVLSTSQILGSPKRRAHLWRIVCVKFTLLICKGYCPVFIDVGWPILIVDGSIP